jgi:hypothetical protein
MISILKKPKAAIALNVSGDPFHPGSTVNVEITVSSMESFTVRSRTVELSCTEVYWQIVSTGKSTYHQKRRHKLLKVKEPFLGSTDFTLGMSTRELVKFTIPEDLPPTVCGKTVNISWQLKASLDVVNKRDIQAKHELNVSPIAIAVAVMEDSYLDFPNKTKASSDNGELIMALASKSGIGGGTLRGSLEAIMKKTMSVDEIRVELEVKESAGTRSSKVVADAVPFGEKVSLTGGGYRKWSFELKIPDTPPPTVQTKKSSVAWAIKGIFDKRLKRDFKVIMPIQVF